tara:strand:- start:163 stop:861 length:699 start_codon:yes stop_codon:yes gene_type:complete
MNKAATYWTLGLASVVVGGGIFFAFRDKISHLANVKLKVRSIPQFQKRLIHQANLEADKFSGYNELSPQTAAIIQQYWRDGVGYEYELSDIETPSWQNNHYWSAAFISWIMRAVGAGDEFKYSERHATYVRDAIINAEHEVGSIRAFNAEDTKPYYGDIVCKRRASSDATYNDVSANDTLHCDIVTEFSSDYITVVGGNVNNKVDRSEIAIDSDGYIKDEDYFVIIKADIQD